MKIGKLIDSKGFLIVFFWVVAVLAQPPASPHIVAEGLGRAYGDPKIPFVLQNTKPGYAASGVEIARTSDALYIDATPCLTKSKRIVAFAKPYTEGKVSDAVCNGKNYQQIQVIQE